ncbi:MAG TPA: TIGR01244 family sulfur transferase [Allosphingosinicella sp.]|nr:TIGR01244 family sulfur transferase [Allosphingosinicella sp.]
MKRIDDRTWVSGQIAPEQVAALAQQGFTTIVNNRPDGEELGQPPAAEIEAAARAAGLEYRHVPVASGLSEAQVAAMSEALQASDGKALAFCRSGTRSTYLWALARRSCGDGPEDIARKAAAAGYDLTPILPYLGSN